MVNKKILAAGSAAAAAAAKKKGKRASGFSKFVDSDSEDDPRLDKEINEDGDDEGGLSSEDDEKEFLRRVKQEDDDYGNTSSDDDSDDDGPIRWDDDLDEDEIIEEDDVDYDDDDKDADLPRRPEIVPGDSSDEEGLEERNTIGNVPLWWYKDEDHIGYDLSGNKIIKQKRKDTLDEHIARNDDPEFWRTVYDEKNDEELRLTDKELRLLRRIQSGKLEPTIDPYEPYIDFFQLDEPGLPINDTNIPPKRRFIPSKTEEKKIIQYVRQIRNGVFNNKKKKKKKTLYYDMWADESNEGPTKGNLVPFRKPKLPGHAESYRPPEEYLFTEKETENWKSSVRQDRKTDFLPARYNNLRSVPAFNGLMFNRFSRCMDLFLCPRKPRRSNVKKMPDPNTLLPELPKPSELKPFPSTLSIQFVGHVGRVNSIQVHLLGQYLVSGGQDRSVRVWDVESGRCLRKWDLPAAETGEAGVVQVAFCPNPTVYLVAAAAGTSMFFFDCQLGDDKPASEIVKSLFAEAKSAAASVPASPHCEWREPDANNSLAVDGLLATMKLKHHILKFSFHHKGDYLVTLAPEGNSSAILIHQLSKRSTQCPFKKSKKDAKSVLFHPAKPFLFVADSRSVSVYHLLKQKLVHRMRGGFKQLCTMDVHPLGDNVIVGSHDKRLSWFDMDLSSLPYRTIRYTKFGVSSVRYHPRLPLFLGGGMDGHLFVFHGKVYNDLLQNAQIVPLKKIRAHKYTSEHDGVVDCCFHPYQPWAFSSGGDGTIRLWTEL